MAGSKREFFATHNEYLNYYKNEESWAAGDTPLGSYNLKLVTGVNLDKEYVVIQFYGKEASRKLRAETQEEAEQWVPHCIPWGRQF